MKATELRLGNWIKIDKGYAKVVNLQTSEFREWDVGDGMPITVEMPNGDYYNCTEKEVEGIQITFEQASELTRLMRSCLDFMTDRLHFYSVNVDGEFSVKYIHEVQNAYFAANKEELNLESLFDKKA